MSDPPLLEPVEQTWERVAAARERLAGIAHRTPVMTSKTLDERVGAQVFLKCESFQRTGAFKFRGAYNAISTLSAEERAAGVLAYSSGNHAQAVALVCRLLEVPATIVMPSDAPAIKRAATEGYGAEVVPYDREVIDRRTVAARLLEERRLTLVPPFDHPQVLAGQGTAACELIEDHGPLDLILVPCGGAGLLSGTAVAASRLAPGCRVIGIEPELADDATRSFRTGVLHRVENPPTIADGTRTASLGSWTFALVRELVSDMQTVTEESILEAVRFLALRLKLVVEPSGALGVAALLSGVVTARGRIGVILSGGNVDGGTLASILSASPESGVA